MTAGVILANAKLRMHTTDGRLLAFRGWKGVYVDFMYNIFISMSPRMIFELDESWASEASNRGDFCVWREWLMQGLEIVRSGVGLSIKNRTRHPDLCSLWTLVLKLLDVVACWWLSFSHPSTS